MFPFRVYNNVIVAGLSLYFLTNPADVCVASKRIHRAFRMGNNESNGLTQLACMQLLVLQKLFSKDLQYMI